MRAAILLALVLGVAACSAPPLAPSATPPAPKPETGVTVSGQARVGVTF
ncbi:argininosuccinate lyase [Shimia sp. CNT1-13L.2]|nr:argininosuccinate lyase [Shimia sp. CNT1-13L.2]MCP9480602.1 argininosuccinate lyase [Shimia sp. CNT1-13L.2]